ncbi:MAG TPA: helix-turn-helix transcriptional regulator [Candidatus Acidoferrales bacterium]
MASVNTNAYANSGGGGAGTATLAGGNYYGAIQAKRECHGAIFTELGHDTPRKLPKHSHELAFFLILLRGHYGEEYGREKRQFEPFTAMFRPAHVPHQDEIGPSGVRLFEIELRPKWQSRIANYPGSLSLAREDMRGGAMLWLGMKLFRESLRSEEPDGLSVESLLAELVAYAARLKQEESRQEPVWLRRVLDKLAIEHCEKLTLDGLSKEARVHPVHLSRVFRRFVGEGIGEYVHRLRIRTACERLLSPEASMAEISMETGFADQSHFCRVFRRITGMTPHSFRTSLGLRPEAPRLIATA